MDIINAIYEYVQMASDWDSNQEMFFCDSFKEYGSNKEEISSSLRSSVLTNWELKHTYLDALVHHHKDLKNFWKEMIQKGINDRFDIKRPYHQQLRELDHELLNIFTEWEFINPLQS